MDNDDDKTALLNQKQPSSSGEETFILKNRPFGALDKTQKLDRDNLNPSASSGGEEVGNETRIIRPGEDVIDRGPASVMQKQETDPVVAWLVVLAGPGKGSFRPIFYGNNSIGRSKTQRVPIDFGDDSISSEEQAYIQYNYKKREFLFIPNLAKHNVVEVNADNPTAPVVLQMHDEIRMGNTVLCFVPFCGHHFDWGDLDE